MEASRGPGARRLRCPPRRTAARRHYVCCVPNSPSSRINDPRITEKRNPRTTNIDLASPIEIVDLIAAEDARVPEAVRSQRTEIARAIELAEATFRAGGRLFYVGAGTS